MNFAEAAITNKVIKGSIVDIDTQIDLDKFDTFENAIICAHNTEKSLFFDLLKEDFLEKFNPIYEE